MSVDSRTAMEAAFDLHATENNDGEIETLPTDPASAGEGGDEGTAGEGQLPAGDTAELSEEPDAAGTSPAQRARDAAGKFTKSDGDRQPLPKDGTKPAKDPVAADPNDPTNKAPQSWKPTAREAWGKLPKEAREEVVRREREIDNAFRQTSEMRGYATAIHKTIAPYEALIRAEGGNHVTAVDNLLKSAYILRQGDPQTKTSMVAQMIVKHGIDIDMLDNALQGLVGQRQNGQVPQQRMDPMLQHFQQELAPIKQFIGQLQGRQQEIQTQSVQSMEQELTAFASDPKNQYFGDVSDIMADILDTGAKRGVKITLQDAYRRAIVAHPEISQLVARQQVSASATQRSAAARRAQNASASLPSGGAPAGAAENTGPMDRRSAIEAAWEQSESRGS